MTERTPTMLQGRALEHFRRTIATASTSTLDRLGRACFRRARAAADAGDARLASVLQAYGAAVLDEVDVRRVVIPDTPDDLIDAEGCLAADLQIPDGWVE